MGVVTQIKIWTTPQLRSDLYCVMENIIEKKSFDFAVRIVRLYKYLCDKKKRNL